jgi:hypothetical protein
MFSCLHRFSSCANRTKISQQNYLSRSKATKRVGNQSDAGGTGDEGESFTEIAEPPDCLERSSEQLEWELTRWPEGAEL